MKPQEPIPHTYRISTLNKIFAISSLVLLTLVGVLVVVDYARGWKRFQLVFLQLQRDRLSQQLQQMEEAHSREDLARIERQIRENMARIAADREAFRKAQVRLDDWEGRHYAADQNFRFAKATLDAMRYEAELSALRRSRGWEDTQRRYQEQADRVQKLKVTLEDVTAKRDAARAEIGEWTSLIEEAERQRETLLADIDLVQKQLEQVRTGSQFLVLNFPLLDFINPTLKIEQVVVRDLFIDMNFLHVPRVDRCQTCHQAIDRPGYESRQEAARLIEEIEGQLVNFQIPAERIPEFRERLEVLRATANHPRNLANPYRTHPRLDVFVGSASPHPLLEFGCTGCHRGLDRATHFARAGHMPMHQAQRSTWEEKWNWKEQKYLETPMYPRQHLESGCIRCHGAQVTIPQGDEITEAAHMVELYGCHACHKIDTWRFTDLRMPGPDLTGLAEKTTPQWVYRWVAAPHEFRPTTRMPAFFYQRNMVGPEVGPAEREQNVRKQNVEIHSIVRYLFSRSSRRAWQPGPVGDPARGEELVQGLGCLGCHVMQDTVSDENGEVRPARRDDFPLERHYGFNLVGTGTKSNPAWLFHWLKDPRAYYHDAPMPDLRLTDQEAADVASFLMTLRKPEFMKSPVIPADPSAVRDLARSYMVSTMTERQTDARLDRMSLDDQLVFLGEQTIEKYGCYSCHRIEGFEGLKPIGTELTTEGSKNLHLFDFGFAHDYEAHDGKEEHVIHTVPSWIYNKLRAPRVYDQHREKSYHEKLKMPDFHLSEREANLITTLVLGMTKDRISASKLAAQDARSRIVQEGRKLVSQHNCRGCHVVEGHGRAIAQTIEDPGMLPPDLTPEGARVQSEFLFNFLVDPTVMALRPWLTVRMPTFHFTDDEATTLVEHWSADAALPTFETMGYVEPPQRNVEIGGIVFEMLRCRQCHPSGDVSTAATEDLASLAPDLALSRARLRHGWIDDWIRRPNEIVPGTRMPTNFPRDPDTGGFRSPLPLAIDSPAFAASRSRLASHFESEAEMRAALDDVVTITRYLRDYIWSIGNPEMPKARPAPRPEPPPQRAPTDLPGSELIPASRTASGERSDDGVAPGGR